MDIAKLTLEEINKQAKEWAKERSVGNLEQDEECEYDFKCGMLAARGFLFNTTFPKEFHCFDQHNGGGRCFYPCDSCKYSEK